MAQPQAPRATGAPARDPRGAAIGALPVEAIDTDARDASPHPIWHTKPETASRLRGRIETVVSFAMAQGWRAGPNPAAWRGHLQLLPAVAQGPPDPALRGARLARGARVHGEVREQDSIGAQALEFAILTAARSGEVRGATWDEIDLQARSGPSRPADEGRQGTPRAAVEGGARVLRSMALLRTDRGPVFPGQKLQRPMTDMSLTRPLKRMGRGDLTAHGFRSTFRDWAAEATGHPNHVVEQALAHAIGNAVEAAYRRGDLFEKRVALMTDWAAFLRVRRRRR